MKNRREIKKPISKIKLYQINLREFLLDFILFETVENTAKNFSKKYKNFKLNSIKSKAVKLLF